MKKYFFFDLDGTLCNTGEGVINGFVFALNKLGITVEDKSSLRKIMGPPLDYSLRIFYGLNDSQVETAVKSYRDYYSKIGMYEFVPYDGIEELLVNLKKNSKKLFVATSKPIFFAKKVLERCGFDKYFDGIYGSEFDGTRAKKTEVLQYAVKESGISDLSEGVMIGDRYFDIDGAKAVGLESVGVLFGYGTKEEFEEHGADRIVEKPSEIFDAFIQ